MAGEKYIFQWRVMDDNYKVWRFMCCNILAKGKKIEPSHLFQFSILFKMEWNWWFILNEIYSCSCSLKVLSMLGIQHIEQTTMCGLNWWRCIEGEIFSYIMDRCVESSKLDKEYYMINGVLRIKIANDDC